MYALAEEKNALIFKVEVQGTQETREVDLN
jgi:hypothetical protein